MYIKYKSLIVVVLLINLLSCSVQIPKAPERSLESSKTAINKAVVCCKDFNEMDFSKVLKYDDYPFLIDRQSLAFQFETGKSFFKAFTLPKFESPYVVEVGSWFSEVDISDLSKAHVFKPMVLLLDAQFKPIEIIPYLSYEYFSAWDYSGMSARFLVTDSLRDVKYLVVYTEGDLEQKKVLFRIASVMALPSSFWGIIPETADEVAMSHEGKINISLNKVDLTPKLDLWAENTTYITDALLYSM